MSAATEKEQQQAVTEVFEPFDTRLADRIRALEAQKESLTETVADLRRKAPERAARGFEDAWAKQAQAQADADAAFAASAAAAAAEGASRGVELGEMERWDEVQKTWGRGADGLVGLKKSLGDTLAKLQRAEAVVVEVNGKS